jgi:hypothetical protein
MYYVGILIPINLTVNVLILISLTEHVLEPVTLNEFDHQPAEFANKSNLNRHMRKHVSTMFKYVICRKEFYTSYDLQTHIKVHYLDLLFVCDHEDC